MAPPLEFGNIILIVRKRQRTLRSADPLVILPRLVEHQVYTLVLHLADINVRLCNQWLEAITQTLHEQIFGFVVEPVEGDVPFAVEQRGIETDIDGLRLFPTW